MDCAQASEKFPSLAAFVPQLPEHRKSKEQCVQDPDGEEDFKAETRPRGPHSQLDLNEAGCSSAGAGSPSCALPGSAVSIAKEEQNNGMI